MSDLEKYLIDGRKLAEQMLADNSASDTVGAFCAALGLILRESGEADKALPGVFTAIENIAGCKSNATLAQKMPCPKCWERLIHDAGAREHTGTALTYCEDRGLAVEIAAEHGEVTAWHIKPATADELDDFKRQKTRAHFRDHGIQRVH